MRNPEKKRRSAKRRRKKSDNDRLMTLSMAFALIVDQEIIMHAQKNRKRDRSVILTHFRHLFVLYSSCLACSTNSFFIFSVICKKATQTVNGKTMSNGQQEENIAREARWIARSSVECKFVKKKKLKKNACVPFSNCSKKNSTKSSIF